MRDSQPIIEIRPSQIHGLGLFAKTDIFKNDIILNIQEERIEDSRTENLGELSRFLDTRKDGSRVLITGPEKYCNWPSSGLANTKIIQDGDNRLLVAAKDILINEEITTEHMMR